MDSNRENNYVVNLAADLRGNIIGIAADTLNNRPLAAHQVTIGGTNHSGQWSVVCTTDEKGMLECPMPLGLTGDISADFAGADETLTKNFFPSRQFQFCHTLLPENQIYRPLNGTWLFFLDPPDDFHAPGFDDSSWQEIAVPAHWTMQGFRSESQIGGYRYHFSLDESEDCVKIRFDSVYSSADIWLNGQYLRSHIGGATPFEVDISAAVSRSENILAILVKEHTLASDHIDKMSFYANFSLAGIYRDVYLFTVPKLHIGFVHTRTRFLHPDYAELSGEIMILNESAETRRNLKIDLVVSDDQKTYEYSQTLVCPRDISPWKPLSMSFVFSGMKVRGWNAEQPHLAVLGISLLAEDILVEEAKQKIGFCQVNIEDAQIKINNVPVKIKGACHHDSHPLSGRYLPGYLLKKDLSLLKSANLNAIRTSHYPPQPEVLDICDELGLYVECEAPICWIDIAHKVEITPFLIQLIAEMVARDYNHPSVFMWSMSNESSGQAFALHRALEWIKKNDLLRPAILSGCTSPESNLISRHNPITSELIEKYKDADRPVIWDESFSIFQEIYGDIGECYIDPGMRDYYIEPLMQIYEDFYYSRTVNASMIWAWSDDIFCVPNYGLEYGRITPLVHFAEDYYLTEGRGIVGDAPWGLVDGWRRPKPEYWLLKKLHTPVKISEESAAITDGQLHIDIENRFNFINLRDLKITWSIDDETGLLAADIAPHERKTVLIRPNTELKPGKKINIKIHDPTGFIIDEYAVPLVIKQVKKPDLTFIKPTDLQIRKEKTLSSSGPRIVGNGFEYSISQGSWGMSDGFLHRNLVSGRSVLLEYPTLHILPFNKVFSPLPEIFDWKMTGLDIFRENANVIVKIEGEYPGFQGSYTWIINPDGSLAVSSSFAYNGRDFYARETGLRISVPKSINNLAWDRNSEWQVYPSDHIGRPAGIAKLHPQNNMKPGEGSWSDVPSPMGSADFRSTKRHINWVSLTDESKIGLIVYGQGKQHSRACQDLDRISLHILDYYGGTNVGKWAYHDLCGFTDNYPRGRLICSGDLIESRINLRLVGGGE
ncbi:MAG: glycoside hydrolase family 2 TIM barrel-domain containing protein [Bacillota bacterium]|nr:glycoside hydrolase family 2 TIM barrel-domain containing protein [Bacillota bacterium]